MTRNVTVVFRLQEDVTPEIFAAKVFHALLEGGLLREFESMEELHSGYKWSVNPKQIDYIVAVADAMIETYKDKNKDE